MKGTRFLG